MGNKNAKAAVISEADIEFMAKNTAATKEDVKQQFDQFLQKHPDGKISKKQFKSMMTLCHPKAKPEKLEDHIFPMFDFNRDGSIDFQEFMIVLYIMSNGTPEENLAQIFRIFDDNKDGTISEQEMERIVRDLYCLFDAAEKKTQDKATKKNKSLMKAESKEFAMKAFKEMDVDSDGKVTEQEFITACLAQNVGSENVSSKLALGIIDVFVTE